MEALGIRALSIDCIMQQYVAAATAKPTLPEKLGHRFSTRRQNERLRVCPQVVMLPVQ